MLPHTIRDSLPRFTFLVVPLQEGDRIPLLSILQIRLAIRSHGFPERLPGQNGSLVKFLQRIFPAHPGPIQNVVLHTRPMILNKKFA